MTSKRSISFRKRKDADEIYAYPVVDEEATFDTRNAVVMVDYLADGKVQVIAGKIPGMTGYYKNYPDVVEREERKVAQHQLAQDLLDKVLDFLAEYDPETDYSETNSGNRHMRDVYVEVDEEKRDEVVLQMWKVLSYLERKYVEFLQEWEEEDYHDYNSLEEEIIDITKKSELGN